MRKLESHPLGDWAQCQMGRLGRRALLEGRVDGGIEVSSASAKSVACNVSLEGVCVVVRKILLKVQESPRCFIGRVHSWREEFGDLLDRAWSTLLVILASKDPGVYKLGEPFNHRPES
jgi:hypothetical protein